LSARCCQKLSRASASRPRRDFGLMSRCRNAALCSTIACNISKPCTPGIHLSLAGSGVGSAVRSSSSSSMTVTSGMLAAEGGTARLCSTWQHFREVQEAGRCLGSLCSTSHLRAYESGFSLPFVHSLVFQSSAPGRINLAALLLSHISLLTTSALAPAASPPPPPSGGWTAAAVASQTSSSCCSPTSCCSPSSSSSLVLPP
jgi:hypothetical protein